jgi:hypothetical protein
MANGYPLSLDNNQPDALGLLFCNVYDSNLSDSQTFIILQRFQQISLNFILFPTNPFENYFM